MRVARFEVTPATIHRGQAASVVVQLDKAGAPLPVTIGWFGPDGWNVTDQGASASAAAVTLPAPVDRFDRPGTYVAQLRSGLDSLGQANLTVAE